MGIYLDGMIWNRKLLRAGIWLEILITKSTTILFGTLYRPPVGSQFIGAASNTKLEESLSLAIAENKEILLVGDLNASFLPR